MPTKKEIDRAVRAANRRTVAKEKAVAKYSRGLNSTKTAKSLGLDPDDCCTPSMAGAVLGRLSRSGGMRKSGTTEKPRRSKAPTKSKVDPKRPTPTATPKPEPVVASEGAAAKPPAKANTSEPIRMDHLLEDLKASAKDRHVARKFVAKALRKMLHARMRNGFSVKTPNHSMATTLDVFPRAGSFNDAHRAALYDLFGDSGGKSSPYMVLVSPFVGDSSSVPTGVRADYADEFRERVADAAGLPTPKAYVPNVAKPTAKPPRNINSSLSRGDIEALASLLLVELRVEGIHATAKRQRGGAVLVESGETRILLGQTHSGFDVTRVWTETEVGPRLLDVLETRVAPVFARRSPTRTTHKLLYAGLPAARRERNLKEAVRRWGPKLLRVETVPTGAAANEEPRRHLEAVSDPSRKGSDKAKGASIEQGHITTVVKLFADALKASGHDVKLRPKRRAGKTVIDLPVHHDFKGYAALGPVPGGFEFLAGPIEHPGSEVARSLFVETFAPLLGHSPVTVAGSMRFKGFASAKVQESIERYIASVDAGVKTLGVGRADHEERRAARVDRLEERSRKAMRESASRQKQADEISKRFWFHQPILVGHHSEKRMRNDHKRMRNHSERAYEARRKGEHLARRAATAESNTSIFSDDPQALEKLRAKLAEMEAEREEIKRKNKLARAGRLPDAENPENPPHLQDIAGKRLFPQPGYVLRNLSANIKRVNERIETLSKRQGRQAREVSRAGVRVVENGELSRVQVFHDSMPPKEHRVWLKEHGFRWARSEQAWQRQLGDTAWNTAMMYLDEMVERRDDTPYSRVEASAPKSKYTDKDLAFWRSEYATLDKEFPGEFTEDMYNEVGRSFRTRSAGSPWEQAGFYAKFRLGKLSLEEAVAGMYAYGRRDARPKPRSKRKPATSTMSIDVFVEALKAAAADVRGILKVKVQAFSGHRSTVAIAHTAANDGVHGMDSRRLSIWVRGWGKDGEPPKTGRVKMEPKTRGYRGRTATPEKLVAAIVKMLERNAAENWKD